MPKLDYNIYGLDENSMASAAASKALTPKGKEDVWGATFDQSAEAKGNCPDPGTAKANPKDTKGSDSRAKTQGNHGAQD